MEISIDLTREKAIQMLLRNEYDERFVCYVNLNEHDSTEDLNKELESQRDDFENFCDDVQKKFKELMNRRTELKNMMTWELYELGEKQSLWHLTERQKRLI